MIEKTILSNLITNVDYVKVALPHLQEEYFDGSPKIIYKMIRNYITTYKKLPTQNALLVSLDNERLEENLYDEVSDDLKELYLIPDDLQWAIDESEKFCKDKSLMLALSKSLEIRSNSEQPLEKQNKKLPDLGMIPEILKKALSVCFDTSVGHDFFADYEERFRSYNEKVNKIPFKSEILNKITRGGAERKTLNIILAGVNVGKTLGLCSLAADYISQGYNVLYISMEMSEMSISKRIDANVLDIDMNDLDMIGKSVYTSKFTKLREKSHGKLIVKQFPTASKHVGHFSALLNELDIKKSIRPDVVIVDYLGICASSRIRGGSENTYMFVKTVAEEIRGFAVEHNIVVWSAAQTTRGAWGASDIEMGDTAESAGLPAVCDFLMGVLETEETIEAGQQIFKQIKSRYNDKSTLSRWVMNVSKSKQRWSDPDSSGSPTELIKDKKQVEKKKNNMSKIIM